MTVVQGIAKGDRGELAVQAMTEVGVDAIVPWAAARSVAKWRDDRPVQRWRATAREAAKQARRPWLPTVTAAESTAAVARRLSATALVLHEDAHQRLATVELPTDGELILVVGPEGGIAPEELAAFEAAGAVPVRLGRLGAAHVDGRGRGAGRPVGAPRPLVAPLLARRGASR